MIAPLGNYGLKGVAWYQGESDAGMWEPYAAKLGSLMGAWRGSSASGVNRRSRHDAPLADSKSLVAARPRG